MIRFALRRRLGGVLLASTLVLLAGCATGPDRRDPFEPFNRRVTQFNDSVDALVLKPVATGYRKAVPAMVRTGVSNFFGNLSDGWSMANSLLQLKLQDAAGSWMRVGVNTFFGLGGVLDVASEMGIDRHHEDFGQTLGRWGVPTGPYLVLPLLGPSTVRDSLALPVDRQGDPLRLLDTSSETALYTLRVIDVRSNLLRAGNVLDEVAFDKYRFTRDAYLQIRRAETFDHDPDRRDEGGDGQDGNEGKLDPLEPEPDAAPPADAAPPPAGEPKATPAR